VESKRENLCIMKTTALQLRNSVNWSHVRLALLLIPLACFALAPQIQADCQEGCDTVNFNTFLGEDALLNHSGVHNTAVGFNTLTNNANSSNNTAVGSAALEFNTFGDSNTAIGAGALEHNTGGGFNTAIGDEALYLNTTGRDNTANGYFALFGNKTGRENVADGVFALGANRNGRGNTASGYNALSTSTIGNLNIALGYKAGVNLTGDKNIAIGNGGVEGESSTIRIGSADQTTTFIAGISGATVPTGVAVIVDAEGHLGTTTSSVRFKEDIKPMDKASEAILALKPVTFRYKHELDPNGIPQFGLVAEDVDKVNPDLVACDEQGKPYTVRYEAVNAMLLNEFLKEHRKVQELEANAAEQQKQIETLTAGLQRVSAQLELSKAAPETVLNNR
jgi:hypothetical protein